MITWSSPSPLTEGGTAGSISIGSEGSRPSSASTSLSPAIQVEAGTGDEDEGGRAFSGGRCRGDARHGLKNLAHRAPDADGPVPVAMRVWPCTLFAQHPHTGTLAILLWNFLATCWKLIKTQQSMKRGCMHV
jgi:hypothetical protein